MFHWEEHFVGYIHQNYPNLSKCANFHCSHRPLTLTFLILHFHTAGGCDSCLRKHFQKLLLRCCQRYWKQRSCWHWYCREHWYTVDAPWLLNSTSYSCHCRGLVHSRCAMSAKLDNRQLFLLLQSTGAK